MSTELIKLPAKKRNAPQAEHGVDRDELVDAILFNSASYRDCGELIPTTDPTLGGRPRIYPNWIVDICIDLSSAYGSNRALFTAFHKRDLWRRWQKILEEDVFPDDPTMRLPDRPPTRTWYVKRIALIPPDQIRQAQDDNTSHAAVVCDETGLCDPNGPGSNTHPHASRTIHHDGKVLAAPTKNPKGSKRIGQFLDPATGEVTEQEVDRRYVEGAREHKVAKTQGPDQRRKGVKPGSKSEKSAVNGVYTMHAEVRGIRPHHRVILAVEHVPTEKDQNNSEVHVTEETLIRLAEKFPGVHASTGDGVIQGASINRIVRATGWTVYSPVTAARIDADGARTEKEHKLRDEIFVARDGSTEIVEVWAKQGGLCQRVFLADGTSTLEPLVRKENKVPRNADGTYRSYVYYDLPNPFGGTSRTISESTLTDPKKDRSFNRSEHVRQIPPVDPKGKEMKGWRQDSESINRGIDDRNPLGRARGWSAHTQLLDQIGYARTVNSLTRWRYGTTRRQRQVA